MLGNKSVFLYVGPHKSGNFYLRDQIFPYVEDIYDVRTRDPEIIDRLIDAMSENPLFLDIENLKSEIYERLTNVSPSKIVISHPDFFGTYQQMATYIHFYSKQFADNSSRTDLLSRVFPDGKVILTPRRQDTWIESYYRGVLKSSQSVRIEEFVEPNIGPNVNWSTTNKPACDIDTLDWGVYVANFFQKFGRKNVTVIPYEMFLGETNKALDLLFEFLDVPPYYPSEYRVVNPGYSALSCRIALALNQFVHTNINRFGFIPNRPMFKYFLARREKSVVFRILAGVSRRMSLHWFLSNVVDRIAESKGDLLGEERRKQIIEMYKFKNRAYGELIGLDLSRYGYY